MRVVLLLGAGATVSDVATKARKDRPPLDRHFFAEARLTHSTAVGQVRRYIERTYASDILEPPNDRLERVMALIYTDLFNPALEDDALKAFRGLLNLFTRRLAMTTNGIRATNKRLAYRIIASYFSKGVRPQDLTVITFNQDIQVEKHLHLMSTVKRWQSIGDKIFAFPGLYALPAASSTVTGPSGAPAAEVFPSTGNAQECITLLKLHGSLNWYSCHSNQEPSRTAMFRRDRKIRITSRHTIDPGMVLQSTQRSMYTLPVVVPPVTHKSAVLHQDMEGLWRLAEQRLTEADEVLIFGYSCPELDFESSNQLRRSQVSRSEPANVCVIDPAPSVPTRYISLLEARRLHYFASAHDFLERIGPEA